MKNRPLLLLLIALLLLNLPALAHSAEPVPAAPDPLLHFAPATGHVQREPLLHTPPFAPDADLLHVVFIDMGMNDAILLESGGQYLLVDGGDWGQNAHVLRYLREHGIDHIDWMFSTHAHNDHMEGQRRLLSEGIRVGQYFSPYGPNVGLPKFSKMLKLLDKLGMAPATVQQGDRMMLGNAQLHFYRNDEFRDTEATQNHASMLTRVQLASAACCCRPTSPTTASGCW